jgi:hypothetical protein
MVFVYYNLRLWLKRIDKTQTQRPFHWDANDTMTPWRVEVEKPIMEDAPRWLEEDVDMLEGEKVKEDVPLLVQMYLEEGIENVSQPLPLQRQVASRRHLT